jgi:hypothetical protein
MIMTLWNLIVDFFTLDPAITAQSVEQTAWIPIAMAAVSMAGSLYDKYQANKSMQEQANKGNEMTEVARQDSMKRLSPDEMFTAFQTFFPGLAPDPAGGVGGHGGSQPAKMVGQEFGAGRKNYDPNDSGITTGAVRDPNPGAGAETALANMPTSAFGPGSIDGARAEGGDMQAGGSYLVGEDGPEVVTPQSDGVVSPNPGTGTLPGTEPPPTVGGPSDQSPAGTKIVRGGFENNPTTGTELAMGHMFDFFTNPGRFSTADYERRQESASEGYQSRVQDIDAQAMAGGIDPGSGVAGTMKRGAAMQESKQKAEAARDQQLLEQQLRRQDIGAGQQMLMQFMNYILQLQGARSSAARGQFSNPQVIDPSMGEGLSQFGDLMGQAIKDYNSGDGGSDMPDMSGATPTDPLGWNS